jgi:hypothetical protein
MNMLKDVFVGWGNFLKNNIGILNPKIVKEGERRLLICQNCPIRLNNMCGLCGCFLPAKVVSDSNCPLGKWDSNNKTKI